MANFNQNPSGQAAVVVSMGATFYEESPIGIGTINPDIIIDTFETFITDISGTPKISLSVSGGDTRPSVGLVYPR
jgi:hypothetical protein